MATSTSTCPKCTGTGFEMKENKPKNSTDKLHFIQCSSCGAVVGVLEYYSVNHDLYLIKKKLGIP